MQWDSNLQSKDSYTFILNIFSACTRRSIILMTILHNFTAVSGQFSCPKCTRLACISRFYWHRVHNAPTLCRCAGKHFYGFRHFGATRSEFLKSFFGCQSFRLTLKDPVQTCQSGQKLVSPNVITFDVNIELQTDEILWYVCKIKQKQQEKIKFITLNLITVEIRTWIRDFSWLFEINRLNIGLRIKTKNSPIVEKKSLELTGAFFWISPQHKTKSDLSYGDNLHHDCTCIVVKQTPVLRFWMNALSWRTFFVWLFCFEGPKHIIWVIHTFETPASLHVLAQTFNWGSDRNILSGSELRKRNLAIEVYRSQWPAQCAYMSDIPDFNRFCWQDRKILRALLDFFSWTVKNFESAANLKMQNEKYTFIFIPNIENMESALPLNEKLK